MNEGPSERWAAIWFRVFRDYHSLRAGTWMVEGKTAFLIGRGHAVAVANDNERLTLLRM